MSCEFFATHGFCARGTTCSQLHEGASEGGPGTASGGGGQPGQRQPQPASVVDMVFAFDTTWVMRPWVDQVQAELRTLCRELFAEAAGGQLQVGLITHGCYAGCGVPVLHEALCSDADKLDGFLRRTGASAGVPACKAAYDVVMRKATTEVRWRADATTKALVMVGHDPAEGHPMDLGGTSSKQWRDRLERLAADGVVVYCVQCGDSRHARTFYAECARRTGGQHLQLTNIQNIGLIFKGLCLRGDAAAFRRYHDQLLTSRKVDGELRRALERLGQNLQDDATAHGHVASVGRRLLKDLAEVARGIGPHLAVVPHEEDLFQWHVNVLVEQGPFANLPIHVVLQFPRSYPARPPSARLVTWLPEQHANLQGGHVCLGDLEDGGWSAGYSIVNLLVSIAALVTEPGDQFVRWFDQLGRQQRKQVVARMRATSCACGHLTALPYPPLPGQESCAPLSVVLTPRPSAKPATQAAAPQKQGKKKKTKRGGKKRRTGKKRAAAAAREARKEAQEQLEQKETPRHVRSAAHMVVAGTVAETRARGVWGRLRSDQPFAHHHGAFAFEVALEFFESDGDAPSAFVVGFGAPDDSFLGVTSAGLAVLPSNVVLDEPVFRAEPAVAFDRGDVVTCAVLLPPLVPRVQVVVARNHVAVAVVHPAPDEAWPAQGEWYPTVMLKDARARLLLNESPELTKFAQAVLPSTGGGGGTAARLWALAATPEVRGVAWADAMPLPKARLRALARVRNRALTADALSVVFANLVYEELVHCWQVCRHWREAMGRFNILERHELRCFFTRATVAEDVLGVGVLVKYSEDDGRRPRAAGALPWITEARTSMDVVSRRAWEEYGVRQDCLGGAMTHFLPLAIHRAHARRASDELRARVAAMCQLPGPEACTAEAALYALGAVMNQFVVQLMSATADEDGAVQSRRQQKQRDLVAKHASEKALVGYVAFHHLLLHACELWPRMRAVAGETVAKFVADEQFRTKRHVPDLGKFLVNLAVMPHAQRKAMKWGAFWRKFVGESMDRRVKWFIRDLPHLADPRLGDERRLADTLRATRVSRRLVSFQHWFFHHVAAPAGMTPAKLLTRYNDRWGRPTPALRRALLRQVRGLLHGKESWVAYFRSLSVPVKPQEIPGMLRRAVERSLEKGYHRVYTPRAPNFPPRRGGNGPSTAGNRPVSAPPRRSPGNASSGGGSAWQPRPVKRRLFTPTFSSRFGDVAPPKNKQATKAKKQQRRQQQDSARRRQGQAASKTAFRVTDVLAGTSLGEVREHVEGHAFALGGACRVVSVTRGDEEGVFVFVVSSLSAEGPAALRRKLAGSRLRGIRFGSVKTSLAAGTGPNRSSRR